MIVCLHGDWEWRRRIGLDKRDLGCLRSGGDLAALEHGLEVVRNETSGGQSFSLKSVIQSNPFQLSLERTDSSSACSGDRRVPVPGQSA